MARSPLATPYPAAPDFPLCRGQNKTPRNILFISGSTVSTGYSPTAPRGEGGGASHQRGIAFPRPSGRLYGFRRQRRYKKWRRRRRTSPAQRYYITPEGGALNPSGRRQPVPDRTLGAQGQRPGGAINPRPRKRASTFGNTRKHRPGPDPDRAHLQPIYILIYYSLFSCKALEFMIKYHYVVSTYLNKEMGIV